MRIRLTAFKLCIMSSGFSCNYTKLKKYSDHPEAGSVIGSSPRYIILFLWMVGRYQRLLLASPEQILYCWAMREAQDSHYIPEIWSQFQINYDNPLQYSSLENPRDRGA